VTVTAVTTLSGTKYASKVTTASTSVTKTVTLPTQTVTRIPTTVYAACTADNIADVYHNSTNGQDYKFLDFYGMNQEFQISDSLRSAYECCVKSFDYSNAAAWVWNPFQSGEGGVCSLQNSIQTCDANDRNRISYYVAALDFESYPIFIGNTGCGEVMAVDTRYVYAN
jgi:hypothetical protein